MLSDASNDESIPLDSFTPESFEAILNYMYGKPLQFNIHVIFDYSYY